jgi:hypothetical protein
LRAQGVADKRVDRLIGKRPPIFLLQPLPEGLVARQALGLGHAMAEGLPHRLGQQGCCAWGLSDREPLGHAPGRIGG